MRIAIVTTNFSSLSSTGKVFAPLGLAKRSAEGLQKRGHDVTLFASSDSHSEVKIISGGLPALDNNEKWNETIKKIEKYHEKSEKYIEVVRGNYELFLAGEVSKRADEFDIIQTHSTPRMVQFASLTNTPVVVTSHDPYTHPSGSGAVKTIYEELSKRNKNLYFLSLSNSQRKQAENLPFTGTVYNGIDVGKFQPTFKEGDYLLFVGRLIPGKGAHTAIEVAQKTGEKLKIAGPLTKSYNKYWKEQVEPFLNNEITYEGMLPQEKLIPLYQKAKALLMPIESEESFGLVMAEAMACGTPVIGFNRHSVPEVVKDGKTGFVVESKEEMVSALKKVKSIDRSRCRKEVEERFTTEKMVERYEKAYEKIIKLHQEK